MVQPGAPNNPAEDQAPEGLGIKLLHVEFARDTSGFRWNGPVYPLTVRYTARIRQQVRIGEKRWIFTRQPQREDSAPAGPAIHEPA